MRSERIEQYQQSSVVCAGQRACGVYFIKQTHHRSDGGVELKCFDVLADLLDGLVHGSAELVAVLVAGNYLLLHSPYSVEEALAALDAVLLPRSSLFEVAYEHLVKTEGIGTVFLYNIVRIYNVALGLGHLCELAGTLGVLAEYHTVGGALHVRLLAGNNALIIQELVPEAAVQQVERGVLHTAVLPVDRHPVLERFLGCKLLVVVRVAVAQEVPA